MTPVEEAEMLYAQFLMKMDEAGADYAIVWAVMCMVEERSSAFDNIIKRSGDDEGN